MASVVAEIEELYSADVPVLDSIEGLFPDDLQELGPYEEELRSIMLPESPLPEDIRRAIAAMDKLYSKILPLYIRAKIAYENVSDLLDEVVTSNKVGRNAEARKAAGYAKAQSFDMNGTKIDLFEARRRARARYLYLSDILKAIEAKHDRIVALEGAFKIEANLA